MKFKGKKRKFFSVTLLSIYLLAVSGGFLDAYTYYTRNKVFANAETGNMVLMGAYLIEGEWQKMFKYLIPISFFAFGVFVACIIRHKHKNDSFMDWRQKILLVEILTMICVGFMGSNLDILATTLVAFTCAMQCEAFKKIKEYPYASTMCTGNLRSATEAVFDFLTQKDIKFLRRVFFYFGIIFFFIIGAALGRKVSIEAGYKAIWACSILTFGSLILMFSKKYEG